MKKALRALNWLMLISGILIAVLCITMLFTPLENLIVLAVVIGFSMLVSGIAEITSFCGEERAHRSGWLLTSGVITGLLGIWTLFGSGVQALVAIIPFVFAVWVMTSSIVHIAGSVYMKADGFGGWGCIMVLGIAGTILGFLLLFTPMLSRIIVTCSIAFMLIAYGVNNVILFFRLRKLGSDIRQRPVK